MMQNNLDNQWMMIEIKSHILLQSVERLSPDRSALFVYDNQKKHIDILQQQISLLFSKDSITMRSEILGHTGHSTHGFNKSIMINRSAKGLINRKHADGLGTTSTIYSIENMQKTWIVIERFLSKLNVLFVKIWDRLKVHFQVLINRESQQQRVHTKQHLHS